MTFQHKKCDIFKFINTFHTSFGVYHSFFLFFVLLAFAGLGAKPFNILTTPPKKASMLRSRAKFEVIFKHNSGKVSELVRNRNKSSRTKEECTHVPSPEVFTKYYHMNSIQHLDTISQEDIVQNQYISLPYPSVSQDDIGAMKQYYNGNQRHLPLAIYSSLTLENINHYLFRGENNFMYVEMPFKRED